MSAPKITRVETAAIRAVGPSVLIRVWAGDEYGLGPLLWNESDQELGETT